MRGRARLRCELLLPRSGHSFNVVLVGGGSECDVAGCASSFVVGGVFEAFAAFEEEVNASGSASNVVDAIAVVALVEL